jgi:zinc transporter ZupT
VLVLALGLSTLGLFAGSMLVRWARGRTILRPALGGLAIGLIAATILARPFPEMVREGGVFAIVLLSAGYAGSWLLEWGAHGQAAAFGPAFVAVALAGHALTDGAGLAVAFRVAPPVATPAATALIGSLVVHKVTEGLFVASTLASTAGARALVWRLALIGGATVAGGVGGQRLLENMSDAVVRGLVAFGLGIMLRLVFHRHAGPAAVKPAT